MFNRREIQPAQSEIQPQVGLNRAQRRHNKDPQAQERSAIIGEYNRMGRLIDETANVWNQVIDDYGRNLTRIVYHGNPFIIRWLESRRLLPEFLERAHFANLENPFVEPKMLNKFDTQDVFPQRIGGPALFWWQIAEGISFFDIEQTPLLQSENGATLRKDDIKQINLMFHDDKFNPETNQKSVIRQAMLYLVTQKLARPEEKILIPETLRPLHDRILTYFDYYTDLMTNPDLDEMEEARLLSILHFCSPWLPQALGCFIPARKGITPASAIKLYQSRAEFSFLPTFMWKRRILHSMEFSARDAYRRNGLPKEIQTYQHYDAQADLAASQLLKDYYGGLNLSEVDLEDAYTAKEELLNKLTDLYFKYLQEDITRSPQRHLTIALPQHPLFSDVLLTNQNRQTLIFILRFKDENTHLTLEIDKDQKLYGLPAKLIKDNPHFMDLILGDLLPPVLEWVRKHHPGVEPVRLSDYRKPEPVVVPAQQEEKPQYDPKDYAEYRVTKSKRPRILTPIAKLLEGPEPAETSQSQAPKYVVFHSRDQIDQLVGKRVPDKIIDGLMHEIQNFEHGYSKVKILEDVGGLWETKQGSYRLVFRHERDRFFSLVAIGRRESIFRSHQIHPSRSSRF